jgi:hypothetical protein
VRANGAAATQVIGTSPVMLVHVVGTNRAVYLNTRIGAYVHQRVAEPQVAEKLRAMLRPLFISGSVRPRFEVSHASDPAPWPIVVLARKDGEDLLIAIELAATTGARPIDWTAVAHVRPRVRVTLPGTYQVIDLLTETPLGPMNAIETEVSVGDPVLFRLKP